MVDQGENFEAKDDVPPSLQCIDEGQQLPLPCWVVPLGCVELLRCEGNVVDHLFLRSLVQDRSNAELGRIHVNEEGSSFC